jgi:hypothetical protein
MLTLNRPDTLARRSILETVPEGEDVLKRAPDVDKPDMNPSLEGLVAPHFQAYVELPIHQRE